MTTVVEREAAGQKQNIPYIIRAANRKTFREIHQEIRATQVEGVAKALEGFKALQFYKWKRSAAPRMARQLRTMGVEALVPPESFFVKAMKKVGPLEASEVERAASWALGIQQQYEALQPHLTMH